VGTCFSVSLKYVCSTGHNVWDADNNQVRGNVQWVISRNSKKINGHYCLLSPIKVNVKAQNQDSDWVVLEVENVSDYFQSFLDICPTSELPPRLTDLVKGYYAPIHRFQKKENIVELQIWTVRRTKDNAVR
jgi:hypothetical protein